MAELAGVAIGIADVAFRVLKYLKDVKASTETIDGDIAALIEQVEALRDVHGELEVEMKRSLQDDTLQGQERKLWFKLKEILQNGRTLTDELESCVKSIYGNNPRVTGNRDALRKQHRKREREPRLLVHRDRISSYQQSLQQWLIFISRQSTRGHHASHASGLAELTTSVRNLESRLLQTQVTTASQSQSTLEKSHMFALTALSALQQVMCEADNGFVLRRAQTIGNKVFDIPQSVNQFYTGREDEAKQLLNWFSPISFNNPNSDVLQKQKRFVVYGVGGSRKTQFCCKFAQDYRDHFWGIFWVDGRSREQLKITFAENISNFARVDPNERAALYWLSNLKEPWLLIIDNADDPDIDLNSYLPVGNRGHVLVTTRNPANKTYGNIGPGHFEFQGLKDEEASCLLLKTAGQEKPWDAYTSMHAISIAKALGYLALAISHAGGAIRKGLCKLNEFLDFYEREWTRTRTRRRAIKARDTDQSLRVYATFELNFKTIESRGTESGTDGLQLLNTFAFLHCSDIRFDILSRAITNLTIETQYEEKQKQEAQACVSAAPTDWATWWKETAVSIVTFILENRGPAALPSVIRDGRNSRKYDRYRLREALQELTQFSLISHNEKNDSYSIHPLVHKWARERPDLSIADQAVWCEAAASLLSHSILLPPLGRAPEEDEFRRILQPHVDHVRLCQQSIEQRMRDKRMARVNLFPLFESGFNKDKAIMYAKFSTVYAHNGHWEDAKKLQMPVREFTMKVRGLQHPVTRRITLALAGTLFWLGQPDDAATLQQEVVDACTDYLGPCHHETLTAKRTLGDTRFQQGRLADARKLQEEACAGFEKLYHREHEETLQSMSPLGRTIISYYDPSSVRQGYRLIRAAIDGMTKVYGPCDLRTLQARENLATVANISHDQEHAIEAQEAMTDVYETRREELGKEHAYTLVAMVNFAIVKIELGDLEVAERLVLEALPIAKRNYSADHVGILWGLCVLGTIYSRQKRWNEAEQVLTDVTDRQCDLLQGRGKYHGDRLRVLVELANVLNALDKVQECERTVDEVLEGFKKIGGENHPLPVKLNEDRASWRKARRERQDSVIKL